MCGYGWVIPSVGNEIRQEEMKNERSGHSLPPCEMTKKKRALVYDASLQMQGGLDTARPSFNQSRQEEEVIVRHVAVKDGHSVICHATRERQCPCLSNNKFEQQVFAFFRVETCSTQIHIWVRDIYHRCQAEHEAKRQPLERLQAFRHAGVNTTSCPTNAQRGIGPLLPTDNGSPTCGQSNRH